MDRSEWDRRMELALSLCPGDAGAVDEVMGLLHHPQSRAWVSEGLHGVTWARRLVSDNQLALVAAIHARKPGGISLDDLERRHQAYAPGKTETEGFIECAMKFSMPAMLELVLPLQSEHPHLHTIIPGTGTTPHGFAMEGICNVETVTDRKLQQSAITMLENRLRCAEILLAAGAPVMATPDNPRPLEEQLFGCAWPHGLEHRVADLARAYHRAGFLDLDAPLVRESREIPLMAACGKRNRYAASVLIELGCQVPPKLLDRVANEFFFTASQQEKLNSAITEALMRRGVAEARDGIAATALRPPRARAL